MRKIFPPVALLVCALSLSSCLDSHEEVWLNPDASGAARIKLAIPAAAVAFYGGEEGVKKLVEEFTAATPAITSHALETEITDGRLHVDFAATFANALDFLNAASATGGPEIPPVGKEMMGKTDINFSGLSLVFKRRIEMSKVIPGALFIPASQLAGHSVTTIVHLPKAASSHNADSTADGGRTLTWSTSLATALKKPVERNFTMPLPIPWTTISVIVILLLILLATLIYYFRSRKVRREASRM